MSENLKFAVIGGGSWATAIAKMLCVNLSEISWYMRNDAAIEHINKYKHNPNYLSSVEFDTQKLKLTNNINEAVEYADYIIFAIPSAFLHAELEKLTVSLENKIVFSAIKGIVPETSLIVGEHFHIKYDIPFYNIGVITGPCHAEEVADDHAGSIVQAADEHAERVLVLRRDRHRDQCGHGHAEQEQGHAPAARWVGWQCPAHRALTRSPCAAERSLHRPVPPAGQKPAGWWPPRRH